LQELPEDRRAAISAVRDLIRQNIDPSLEEGMQSGMIGYYVPHRVFPQGYHCDPKQPLPFVCLASQKNHMSLYLMCEYMDQDESWFRQQWAKTGKKLDMGKSCVRFKKVDDLALDVIAEFLRRTPVPVYLRRYQAALAAMPARTPARPARKKSAVVAKKPARKSPAAGKSVSAKSTAMKKSLKKSPAKKRRPATKVSRAR
jgi:hypothetical protein